MLAGRDSWYSWYPMGPWPTPRPTSYNWHLRFLSPPPQHRLLYMRNERGRVSDCPSRPLHIRGLVHCPIGQSAFRAPTVVAERWYLAWPSEQKADSRKTPASLAWSPPPDRKQLGEGQEAATDMYGPSRHPFTMFSSWRIESAQGQSSTGSLRTRIDRL